MRKAVPAHIGKRFDRELKEIKALRRLSIDKNLPREISTERLTDGLPEFPEWKILKERLIKEPKKEDKRKMQGGAFI